MNSSAMSATDHTVCNCPVDTKDEDKDDVPHDELGESMSITSWAILPINLTVGTPEPIPHP